MNINTLIHELAQTRDPMNDYAPRAIWVDTFTGTYGGVDSLAIIDITEWSDDDHETWEIMTDSQRNNYALGYRCCDGDYYGPALWTERYAR
jgi:hypothetical protein